MGHVMWLAEDFTFTHANAQALTQRNKLPVWAAAALCVTDRANVQPRPQAKLAFKDFGLQPYSDT